MNRKAWVLFAATSVICGSSFLFIRVAVTGMAPSVVVFGRCVLGALFLVPLAATSGALAGMRRYIVPIAAVACLDMALPTFLTAWTWLATSRPAGQEHPEMVLDSLVSAVRTTGGIGVVGVYLPQDPQAATESAKEGRIAFDFGTLFQKGQRFGTGQCPVKRYNTALRDLIIAGKAAPSLLVSHELPLDAAPDAYDQFDKRADGYTKVLLHP